MFTSISRVIFRSKFILLAVATTVFVSGFAWAQLAAPGKEESFSVLSQPVVVNGVPAFFQGLRGNSRILQHEGISNFVVFGVSVSYPEFNDQYNGFASQLIANPSAVKVSNQLKNGRVRIQEVPVDLVRCNLDFTFCESFPNYTTADVDIDGVGEGDIFEEMFGPDLTCQLRGATTAGSITTATGLNLFGEATLAGGMSRCQGNIEL
jgi:hypothetical protein